MISYNKSELIQQKLLLKVIAWDDLIKQLHAVAQKTEQKTHHKVLFVPLDNYPISSELTFYQAKFLAQGEIKKTYSVVGAHIFNLESLMYRYWSSKEDLSDTVLILVSKEKWRFDESSVSSRVQELSKLSKVWSLGQGQNLRNIPYYYKVVKLKT